MSGFLSSWCIEHLAWQTRQLLKTNNLSLIIDKVANGQYDAYIGVHNKQPAVSPDGALLALCIGKDGKMIWISASKLAAISAEQVRALMQAQCAPLK